MYSTQVRVIDASVNLNTPQVAKRMLDAWTPLANAWSKLKISEDRLKGNTIEDMLSRMDEAGVEKACLIAFDLGVMRVEVEEVGGVVDKYPDRFAGLIGLNPLNIMEASRRLEKSVKDYGFKGAHLYPHWFRLKPTAPQYYPIYAKCVELGIPVAIQVGHSTPGSRTPTVAPPITLEKVALDFPELKIIGLHLGYPWVHEMISVAWRFDNVYACPDAHAPRYWGDDFVKFIDSRGQDKVIFGSDFPVLDLARALREVEELNLREEAKIKFLRENARRVFKV